MFNIAINFVNVPADQDDWNKNCFRKNNRPKHVTRRNVIINVFATLICIKKPVCRADATGIFLANFMILCASHCKKSRDYNKSNNNRINHLKNRLKDK